MKEQWVLYKEFPVWEKEDKHVQAYAVLLTEALQGDGQAARHRRRASGSALPGVPHRFSLALMPIEKDSLVNDKDLADKLDFKFGVSCEGCHGSAADGDGNVRGWYSPHLKPFNYPIDKNPWRFLDPDTKRETFGFADVRSPTSKTKVCVSCHIGDVEQGRIVTHDMYAAGHPPLPGFEIETFVKQMPLHWKEFSDKSPDVQDLFLKHTKDPLYKDGAYKKGSLQRTRSLLAGALAVSSEYLRFVGQMTDDAVKSPIKRPDWPELAVFECAACHQQSAQPRVAADAQAADRRSGPAGAARLAVRAGADRIEDGRSRGRRQARRGAQGARR